MGVVKMKMCDKRIILGLIFISGNCLSMNRPMIKSEREQLAQKRLDTGLIQAVKSGNEAQVKLWLKNGANPLAIDKETNKTAYQIANELENNKIINIFYTHLHPEKQLPQDIGVMIRKYVEDDVSRARTIEEAVNNSKDYINKNPELVGYLIKKKFGQKQLDKELISAASYAKNEYAKLLIKIGADVNTVSSTRFKESPIFIATDYGSNDLIKVMIDAGANVNVQNTNGYTPLIIATNKQTEEGVALIKMLLDAGADPSLKSIIHDNTALDYAKNKFNQTDPKNNPKKSEVLSQMIRLLEAAEASGLASIKTTHNKK